jgi:outer membrane receptor protein involved in Fe transport
MAARYRVHDDLSLYARVASGYRPAQPNIPIIDPLTGLDIAPSLVESDSAWSYEIGAKGKSADGMIDFDIALWRITWDNYQAAVVLNGVSTGGNAEDGLTAYGFESVINIRPTDDLTLTANLGYTSSTVNSDEPGIGAVEGEFLPNLPDWQGSIQWNYAFDVSGDWTGYFGGGVRYTAGAASALSGATSVLNVPISGRTFADVNLTVSNGSVHVGLYATNLFDNRALLNRTDNFLGGVVSNSTGVFERPRTIGANIKVDF